MSRTWHMIVALCLAGCVMPPGVTVVSVPVPSDSVRLFRYKVSSGSYPVYHIAARIKPPPARYCDESPFPCAHTETEVIEPEDEWRVTHVVHGHIFIQSRSYTKRSCIERSKAPTWDGIAATTPFGNCVRHYDFAISINRDGTVLGGWQFIPRNIFVPVRYSIEEGSDNSSTGWPTGIVFVPSIKS
jgi:hypothetical protein